MPYIPGFFPTRNFAARMAPRAKVSRDSARWTT